ncbi:phage capsid protein [Candidatus Tisiphia endosymbiont of Ptychoptera albimana]|uniref:phage capsid protein n=1 Tax=Candidatus Tisiphia endosymbiont of Ptychoptera albimana TaxID=3066260 RepID=UPI001D3D615D|nr:phage capsid protein [Rickettsia endosymbiont of Sericostoma sp. HW-2014]
MEQITDGLKEQFAKNINLVIQQEGSKLRKCVTNGTQDTEVISFESMTTHEVESRTRHPIDPDDHLHGHYADNGDRDRLEQIEFKIPTISRRFLTASAYHWNATMDRNDKLNLLTDPTSHFPKMAGWAMGRQQDRVIISAFASPVRAGRTGNNVINFDVANNVVPVGIRVTDSNLTLNAQAAVAANRAIINSKRAGLTVDKLIKAHHILKKRSFGMYDKLYLLCSSNQISDLLRDPQITNYDYNNVRALVSGEVNSFLGFTFITSEMLGGIFDNTGDANQSRYAVKDCYAFNEGAIRFNTVSGSNKKGIEELVQYHYAKVLYYSEAFGASRDNEQAVVVIKCLENYDRSSHHGILWQAVANENHKRGVHSITMPWQMFGNQCRNSDNTEDIEDNDLTVIANNNLATRVRGLVMRRAAADDEFGGGIVESENEDDA